MQTRYGKHSPTFNARVFPLTGSPCSAANPANALLNYLYAILEAEARIALLSIGLDPGLGVLHADLRARDSLALDLIEAIRPQVDRFVLDLLSTHTFAARDFFETRQGVCRVLPPFTHRLAEMTPRWTKAVAPVAEAIAHTFVRTQGNAGPRIAAVPTLLTEANRRAGREASKRKGKDRELPELGFPRACQECGAALGNPSRKYCDACFPARREAVVVSFATAGPSALARWREEKTDPAHTKEVRRKQGLRAAENVRANTEWEKAHSPKNLNLDFNREILPALQKLPLTKIMEATGLSLRYCSLIRRGMKVPHPRHWRALANLSR